MRAQVIGLQNKLDQLVIKLEDEAILRSHFQVLNSELESKVAQLASENVKQAEILDGFRAHFETRINALMAQSDAPVDHAHHLVYISKLTQIRNNDVSTY